MGREEVVLDKLLTLLLGLNTLLLYVFQDRDFIGQQVWRRVRLIM